MGPSDTFILAALTTTKALSAAEARGVVGWWAAERKPDESLVAFLVRREVFAPTSAEMTRLLESGSPAPHQADNLFAERGVERLRKNLGLAESRPEPANLVDCLARPPRRVMDQADRRPAQSPRAARQPTPAVRAGTLLGKYLVVEQIGRGASCVVFRGLHRSLNLTVAIKVLPHESDPDDPVVRERFRAEARLQARLDHPNIVRVLDFEDEVALPYMVLEYVAGPTLADHIAKSGRVPPDQALKAVLQISEALAAANQIGVVHRDVKPANILLSADGRRAKLADLGLALVVGPARAAAASGTRRDTVVGTAAYIAPEQALSVPDIDHRADIYSLGATLYHAVTGRLVFTGRSRLEVLFKHVREPVVPPEQLVPELGANVSAVVLKMMAKDAGARQQTYAELLGDLRSLVRRAPPAAPTPAAPAPAAAAPTSPATDSHTALNSSAWRKWFGSRPPPTGAPAR